MLIFEANVTQKESSSFLLPRKLDLVKIAKGRNSKLNKIFRTDLFVVILRKCLMNANQLQLFFKSVYLKIKNDHFRLKGIQTF